MRRKRSLTILIAFALAANTIMAAEESPTMDDAPQPVAETPPPDARPLVENGGFRSAPGFRTDFSRATIHASDVVSGGPQKDGIPAVDLPIFTTSAEADGWLGEDEPVFVVTADGQTHIYPVQILTYHEIVNDVVGNTPVTVTYCPLCNSGLAFGREFNDMVLDFGTTGRLRLSNLIMYDRQSETWWQQATGEGLVGRFAGFRLDLYPMLMVPWNRARDRFPDATVLSRDTGHDRPYGNNPYAGYDTSRQPFLYSGPRTPGPYTAMDRVLEVVQDGQSAVFPYPVLAKELLAQREVGDLSVVVFWVSGTTSALDSRSIASGRDVGVANAFSATIGGRRLTFEVEANGFRDIQTGTTWDAFGVGVAGELEGSVLAPVVGVQHFWFSYSAFAEDGRWQPVE
jgi:uncharacterized protein DUF3179